MNNFRQRWAIKTYFLRKRWMGTALYGFFHPKTEQEYGRLCMLGDSLLVTVINNITTGVFLTGFYLAAGLSAVDVGGLGVIPYFMSICSIFSPFILARFKKRKKFICIGRFTTYILKFVFLSIIPLANFSKGTTVAIIAVLLIVSYGLTMIYSPGISEWHFSYLPEESRANFFTLQQILNGAIGGVSLVISGFIADKMQQSENPLSFFIVLRLFALVIGALNIYMLSRPAEPTYDTAEKSSILSIFKIPFANKKFLATMGIVFMWNFLVFLPASAFDVYILQTVKIPYLMVTTLTASSAIMLILFAPLWRRYLRRGSWLKALAVAVIINAPFTALMGFVNTENFMWLYTLGRIGQIFISVGIAITMANVPYLALPAKGKTACLSFTLLVTNIAAFFGQSGGTLLYSKLGWVRFTLFGGEYSIVNILVFVQAALMVILGIYAWLLAPTLSNTQKKRET